MKTVKLDDLLDVIVESVVGIDEFLGIELDVGFDVLPPHLM